MDGGVESDFAPHYQKVSQDLIDARPSDRDHDHDHDHDHTLIAQNSFPSIRYLFGDEPNLLGQAPTFPPIDPLPPQSPAGEPSMDMPENAQAVIDLTGDDSDPIEIPDFDIIDAPSTRATRPPNFEREIIDVDALPDRPEILSPAIEPDSPDIQVTFARTIQPGSSTGIGSAPPAQPVEPRVNHLRRWRFPPNVRITSSTHTSALPTPSPSYLNQQLAMLAQNFIEIPRFWQDDWYQESNLTSPAEQVLEHANSQAIGQAAEQESQQGASEQTTEQSPRAYTAWYSRGRGMASSLQTPTSAFSNFPRPQMDYGATALNDGPPAAKPPTPAREGFTRSPNEDDELICPNCDEELGVGDTEQKRAVFYSKACGHVYCGECTNNRRKGKTDPWRLKVAPFSDCKVCKVGVPPKREMRQIYL